MKNLLVAAIKIIDTYIYIYILILYEYIVFCVESEFSEDSRSSDMDICII